MSNLPEAFQKAWEQREPRMIFSTVDSNGEPNACLLYTSDAADDLQPV